MILKNSIMIKVSIIIYYSIISNYRIDNDDIKRTLKTYKNENARVYIGREKETAVYCVRY